MSLFRSISNLYVREIVQLTEMYLFSIHGDPYLGVQILRVQKEVIYIKERLHHLA